MNRYARLQEVPSGQRSAADALQGFVEHAKQSLPYNVVWESTSWSIGDTNVKARAHLAHKKSLLFTQHSGSRVPVEQRTAFEPNFADLVKACIVRRRNDRGMESGPQMVFVRAARHLYEALPLPVRRDVTLINRGHFVAAETLSLQREKKSSAYRACTRLEELARMLDRHGLTRAPIEFRTSVQRPRDERDRTTAEFKDRTAGLPTAAALSALAALANDERLLANPLDRLRIRVTEILFACGFRIGEVLTLPAKPLVREFILDAGTLRLDARTGEPVERIGLRYWPEKGGDPVVKWIPTVANPLVVRAIAELEDLCAAARENARWLEHHPGDVRLELDDAETLSSRRAAEVIGVSTGVNFNQWIRQRRRGGRAVLEASPDGFRITGANLRRALAADRFDKPVVVSASGKRQYLGDSLLVMFLWDWSDNRPPNRFISMPITWGMLSTFLTGREGMPSVFERYGSRDERGQPFRFRSHDFRRLINMVAQRGGLSQVEIAQWMGRRRIEDNTAYDLRSAAEMASEMRSLIEKNEVFGSIADQVRALPVTERSDFLNQRLTMLHTTPHGQCGSNIAENPCETAVSCLGGCRHYLRRKNEPKSRAGLLRIERETLVALERARDAGDRGQAKNWVASHETVLRTVRAALAIDDDPTVVDGELRPVNPDGPDRGEPL